MDSQKQEVQGRNIFQEEAYEISMCPTEKYLNEEVRRFSDSIRSLRSSE